MAAERAAGRQRCRRGGRPRAVAQRLLDERRPTERARRCERERETARARSPYRSRDIGDWAHPHTQLAVALLNKAHLCIYYTTSIALYLAHLAMVHGEKRFSGPRAASTGVGKFGFCGQTRDSNSKGGGGLQP